jgi:hypothetical protein
LCGSQAFNQGACGFPSHTPNFDTCTAGFFSDRLFGYIFAGEHYFLLGLHLLATTPLFFKNDYFGMIHVRHTLNNDCVRE